MRSFATLSYRGQIGRLRRLAEAALREYPVAAVRLVPLRHDENTTFRVDGARGDRSVLRIHRVTGSPFHPPRTTAEVASELMWLSALGRETDLSVPEPIAARDGSLACVARTEGVPEERTCVLFRWRIGRFIDAGLRPAHLASVGRLIAELHEHAIGFRPPTGFERWRVGHLDDAVVAYALDEVGEPFGSAAAMTVGEVLELVRLTQDELGTGPDSYGLIHGDLHQDNYFFNGNEVRAIDFDDCGWGWFAYDLMVPLSELRGRTDYDDLRGALFDGYASVRPLPADLNRSVEIFAMLRGLQLTLWLIEQREHPAFPNWKAHARDGLDELGALVRSVR
jgi:Ser/Thr protein kinase RdoA (MazF antagonist)